MKIELYVFPVLIPAINVGQSHHFAPGKNPRYPLGGKLRGAQNPKSLEMKANSAFCWEFDHKLLVVHSVCVRIGFPISYE